MAQLIFHPRLASFENFQLSLLVREIFANCEFIILVIISFAPSPNFLKNREVDALVEYVIWKLHGHRFQNIYPSMCQPPGLGVIQSDFRFFAGIFKDFLTKIVKKSLLLYSFSYLKINFHAWKLCLCNGMPFLVPTNLEFWKSINIYSSYPTF